MKWSLRNKEYIENLARLEHFILDGVRGMSGSMASHYLKNMYENEYEQILKELKPEEYQKYLKEKEEEKKELIELEREAEMERKEEERRLKKEWIAFGGKV